MHMVCLIALKTVTLCGFWTLRWFIELVNSKYILFLVSISPSFRRVIGLSVVCWGLVVIGVYVAGM
jgi:hypothetical protein